MKKKAPKKAPAKKRPARPAPAPRKRGKTTKPAPAPKPKKAKAAKEEQPEDFATAPIEIWTPKGERTSGYGRPEIDIDLSVVEECAAIGCTLAEIAAVCRVGERTINRRNEDADFKEAIERGRAAGKATLRRFLWINARRGNIAAQIFLAKQPQFLGYVDKVDHEINGGEPIKHEFRIRFVDPPPRVEPGQAAESEADE